MSDERWIVIPRWDDFQHYSTRDPVWIKNHRRLLHDDAYRALTLPQRGVLHGLWLLYAASGREIRDSTLSVSRQLGGRVSRATLEALNDAGFIEFSASKPLASCLPREETEREKIKSEATTTSDPQGYEQGNPQEAVDNGARSLDELRADVEDAIAWPFGEPFSDAS